METSLNITKIERSDDIPLLLAQIQKMDVAALLDKHFPTHGNWQGLSLGTVAVGWLVGLHLKRRRSPAKFRTELVSWAIDDPGGLFENG